MSYDFINCTYETVVVNSTVNSTYLTTPIEQCIGNRLMWAVGDPLITGLIFIGIFGAFVMLQDTRLDVKLAVMIPIIILGVVISGNMFFFVLLLLVLAFIFRGFLLKLFQG